LGDQPLTGAKCGLLAARTFLGHGFRASEK
jgi:hypothetical protein